MMPSVTTQDGSLDLVYSCCRDFHKALAERKQGEVQSLEKGLQKQLTDTSHRNAAWGQKELALSSDHVSTVLHHSGGDLNSIPGSGCNLRHTMPFSL